MRFILSTFAVVAALVLIAVSAACNYLFMQSIGKTETEGLVLGGASVAVDVFKALLPVMIWWAWKDRRYVFMIPALCVFLIFSGWSLASAIGFSATNRGHVTETREGLNAEFTSAQADIARVETKIGNLPVHRSAGIVENDISALRQNRRWKSTKGCADGEATASKSRTFCEGYFKLKGELSAAVEGNRLGRELDRLRNEAKGLKGRGAGTDADPQVSFLAKLLGSDEGSIRTLLIVFIAGLLEVGSGLGLWLATGHSEIFGRKKKAAKSAASNETIPPAQMPAGSPVNDRDALARRYAVEARTVGDIDDFCFDNLHPADEGVLSLPEIYRGYVGWCQVRDFDAMDDAEFRRAFRSMAKDVGLPESGGSYLGVTLATGSAVAVA